jgi:hypothetical protein
MIKPWAVSTCASYWADGVFQVIVDRVQLAPVEPAARHGAGKDRRHGARIENSSIHVPSAPTESYRRRFRARLLDRGLELGEPGRKGSGRVFGPVWQ